MCVFLIRNFLWCTIGVVDFNTPNTPCGRIRMYGECQSVGVGVLFTIICNPPFLRVWNVYTCCLVCIQQPPARVYIQSHPLFNPLTKDTLIGLYSFCSCNMHPCEIRPTLYQMHISSYLYIFCFPLINVSVRINQ